MSDDAPQEVKPYLDEIADRLWSYSAVVMVGAGFSYNAEPVGPVSEPFPSWEMLGDIFYRKLHGRPPGEEARYLSLLKLAEQVQAAFGRPALDRMLRHAIPDLRYEPSRLHSDLLRLPWQDVFTTNYDTLLERARASVTFSHYDVVATTEDLLYAKAPRIVKLHGSFPSPPFVITEEDYRRYPGDYAPFVNTVRQSLLEKTLCLVGFSGDDPNFLRWIGWLRDQVGMETAPKIFLIGVFDAMSEADRKLLNGRGIVPLDLSGFSSDPGRALGHFLVYLEERRTRALEWPSDSGDAPLWAEGSDHGKYREAAVEWRRQRSRYPGWVVVPEDRRRSLWLHTQDWLSTVSQMSSDERDTLETPLDLDVAFELAWRLDRCLFPLTGELATLLEDVAEKYGDATAPLLEKSHWSKSGVFEAVANIRLWLLRHYREEGLEEKWEQVRRAIDESAERLLPEHKARLRLEEALQALYRFDPAEGKRLVVEWQSNENLPFWEAKRAAVMAELGEAEAARSILESSLSAIRAQQSLNPVGEDYTLVSQESLVMLLPWAVENGMVASEPDSGASNILDELSDRWNELTRHKCDPRREIESFTARLRHDPAARREETTSHEFDLGLVSRTIHFGYDEEAVAAYGLLRLYEDIGMP
ncbi:MAG: SIR2 family protein [Gammaproteobacteria bacterium]|nr:SIR2 family protein [Gammaproteobacteria bacterium]